MQVKKQQLEPDMEQQTGSNWDRSVTRLYTVTLLINLYAEFSSIQLLSHVQLFATPWTAACQASLSITNSQSSLKLMPIELAMDNQLIQPSHPLSSPSPPAFSLSQHQGFFQ